MRAWIGKAQMRKFHFLPWFPHACMDRNKSHFTSPLIGDGFPMRAWIGRLGLTTCGLNFWSPHACMDRNGLDGHDRRASRVAPCVHG